MLMQFCWASRVALVFISNGTLFYWRFDQHNMRTWTIDLWSELHLEVVSIEANKIATYFLTGLKRGFVQTL